MRVLALALALLMPVAAYAEADCDDLYFGVAGTPDYPAAFRCYQKDASGNGLMLALMALNGEGTAANADQAMALFQASVKAQNNFKDASAQALEQLIAARQKAVAGVTGQRVDFCKDVAATTIDLGRCAGMAARREKIQAEKALGDVKKNLGTAGGQAMKDLSTAFAAFQTAAGEVAADAYRGGTMASLAATDAAQEVTKELKDTAKAVAAKTPLLSPAPTIAAAKDADAELNAVYGQLMKSLDDQGKKLLKDSERRWMSYRDHWAGVAKESYKSAMSAAEAERMMVTRLTKERTAELKALLAGPEGDGGQTSAAKP